MPRVHGMVLVASCELKLFFPVLAEFVFLLSEQWCLEKSVSYQAVEILER
jgi:uncharacterized membrane protein YbaN (DUF454 family)